MTASQRRFAAIAALLVFSLFSGMARLEAQSNLLPSQTHSGASSGCYYGYCVAAAGDVNADGVPDYVVGGRRSLVGGVTIGNAQVFSGADSSLLYQFEGENQDDEFGISVGGAGDVDGDGHDDILVGAAFADINGSNSGRVYLYSGADGSLIRHHNGPTTNAKFGRSVVGLGDLDGDGYDDYAIGAHSISNGSGGYGRVFIRSGFDGTSILNISAPANNVEFGSTIDNVGDLSGDGLNDIIVGAFRGASANGTDAGRAHVYDTSDGSLIYTYLGADTNDRFGSSVAGIGDANGDGTPDFCVGAQLDDVNAGDNRGKAYLYDGSDGSLLFSFNGPANAGNFGRSVGRVGDWNGDGFQDVVIGGTGNLQSVQVRSGIDGSKLAELGINPWTTANHGAFVCSPGDLNGDGLGDVLVGSYTGDTAGSDFGDAHLYLAPSIAVRSYSSALAPHEQSARWIPDGNLPDATTGSVICEGATPGGLGTAYISLASADFVFASTLAIVVNPDPSLILESASYGYDFSGTLLVPGVSRQNPFLAGFSIYIQFFETSPFLGGSNGLVMDMTL